MALDSRRVFLGFGALVIHPGPTALFTQDGQFTDLGVAYAAHVARDSQASANSRL